MTAENEDGRDILDDAERAGTALGKLGAFGTVNLLFGPSAKVLGEHWAERLNAKIDAKQKSNLDQLIHEASPQLPQTEAIEISPSKVGALLEWTHNAKDVEREKSPQLYEAWKQALVDLASDSFELVSVLSDLNEVEINQLIEGGEIDCKSFQKFKKSGFLNAEETTKGYHQRAILEILDAMAPSSSVVGFGSLIYFNELHWIFYLFIPILFYVSVQSLFEKKIGPKIFGKTQIASLTIKGQYVISRLGHPTPTEYIMA